MTRNSFLVLVAGVCGLSRPVSALGQASPDAWSGVFKLDRGPRVAVQYLPPESDSAMARIRGADGVLTPLIDFQSSARELSFKWGQFSCRLQVKRDSQEGPCRADDGTGAKLTLRLLPKNDLGTARRNSDVITVAELPASASNLYEALTRLRPMWLQGRNAGPLYSQNPLQVMVEGQTRGTVEELKGIELNNVAEVRLYPAIDAIARWGKQYDGGIIYVTMKH